MLEPEQSYESSGCFRGRVQNKGLYKMLVIKWITNKDLIIAHGTLGSLDGREIWGRIGACIYMAESLCCVPESFTLLIDYIGEGNGNLLQYSCLENTMDREAWQATVHGIARVGDDLATKPPLPPYSSIKCKVFLKKRENADDR